MTRSVSTTETRSRNTIQYTVLAPSLDMKRERSMLSPGSLSMAYGVDGRFTGGIRRFPGMKRLSFTDKQSGTNTLYQIKKYDSGWQTYSNVKFFKALTIQKGNSQYLLRGFVFLAQNSGDSQYDVCYYYYDTENSGWYFRELDSNVGATAFVDVEPQGKFLYYARRGQAPEVHWYDTSGSSWSSATMGPGAFTDGAWPDSSTKGSWAAVTTSTTGGVLSDGTYRVVVRLYDSDRNLWSGRTVYKTVDLSGGTDTQYFTLSITGLTHADASSFDKAVIYRTISTDLGNTSRAGALFYKVAEATVSSNQFSHDVGRQETSGDGLSDDIIQNRPWYDPTLAESAGAPPKSGLIATYQETTIMGGTYESSDTRAQVQWSPLHDYDPETFPPENLFRLSQADGELIAFAKAGDFLYAFGDRVVYRFQKIGTQLLFLPLHQSRGPVSRFATTPVGNSLLMCTEQAVSVLNASSGSLVHVGALSRLINDSGEWKGNLSNVSCGSDGVLGAAFLLNPDKEEAAVIWSDTNAVTMLADMTFEFVTTCPLPSSGGNDRAFFADDSLRVVYPDAEGSATKATMMGLTATVNGTATTGTNATTLVDSAATFDAADLILGSTVHFLTGDAAGTSAVITGRSSGTTLTFSSMSPAPASGDRYAVSPIPFRVRYWPLSLGEGRGYPRFMFARRPVKAMSCLVSSLGGEYSGVNGKLTLGVYREGGTSLHTSSEVSLDTDAADNYVSIVADGLVVEPGVECYGSNVTFELLAALVDVKYTGSREVS